MCSSLHSLCIVVIDDELFGVVVNSRIGLARRSHLTCENSQLHFRSRFADFHYLIGLLTHALCYGEACTALAGKRRLCDVLRQVSCLEPAEFLVLTAFHDSLQLYGVRHRIAGFHDTGHRVGVVLKQDIRAVTCLGALCERKVLELSRNGLLRVVAAVVHDIRIGVHHQADVVRCLELFLQVRQQLLCSLEVLLRRHDVECDVLDRAIRSLLVLLLMLVVEFLDVAVAYLHEAVSHGEIRLHSVLCGHTLLAVVECELGIQRICLEQVLEQGCVFLLHVADTNGFLPVQPVGLGLLEVCVHLRVVATFVDSLQQVHHCIAAELAVLVVERTATANDLVNILADTQFAQLVCRDVHTDFVSLCAHCVVHQHHVPCLVANLCVEVFVEIVTTGLNLVHFRQLFFCCLILRVVNLLALNHADVLAATVKETATGVQKVSEDKCQHGQTHNCNQQGAMVSNSL